MKRRKHLGSGEREKISIYLGQELGVREIARRLDRSPSTISEEISRNSIKKGFYQAFVADKRAKARHKKARKKRHSLKSEKLYQHVLDKLRDGWSPEQITGRLKREYPGDKSWSICPETIYRFIYCKSQKDKKLWEYLPRKQKKRKQQNGRNVRRSRIPDRVSISKRPEEINDRSEFGHWEGDTVEGQRRKVAMHTEVERKSRYLEARLVSRITSEDGVNAQIEIFSEHPARARRSTTLDNGRENHLHTRLKSLQMKVFFADPYSSWQRGSNEYHNGLLRRYFPKRTDFTKVDPSELQDIVDEINDRPRKVLDYRTPKESYDLFVKCSDSK